MPAKHTDAIFRTLNLETRPLPAEWIRDITNRVHAEPDGDHLADILGLNTEQDTTT